MDRISSGLLALDVIKIRLNKPGGANKETATFHAANSHLGGLIS